MKWIARLLVLYIANAFALFLAANVVAGFMLVNDLWRLMYVALVLTILNVLMKPFIKLVLSPIIILTLGLGLLLVNAIVLYVLDKLSPDLTIDGIQALLLGSLIVGATNFVTHLATHHK